MSFTIKIKAANKAEARAQLDESRNNQRPNFPHPVSDFIEHALTGIDGDGPIVIEGSGHLAREGAHAISHIELTVGLAEHLAKAKPAKESVEKKGVFGGRRSK